MGSHRMWLVLLAATIVRGEPSLTVQTTYINEHGSGWFFFLASGPTGNPTYAADHRQHCIRKLEAETGMWHVWAGVCDPTTPGYHNGARSSARFHQPQGMCMHPRGQLLVADKGNHCVRQVTEEGSVSTYAGTCGEAGDTDGSAQEALFSDVFDVQCLANCSVLVTEPNTGRVRLILEQSSPLQDAIHDLSSRNKCDSKNAHGFWSHKQAWALGVAACLIGALVGAALLGTEAYAAKVQRSLNINIEQYQTLQGANQDCEAGGNVRVDDISNQPNGLMHAMPCWFGKILPSNMFSTRNRVSATAVGTPDAIEQTADAAAQDAFSELNAKQAAQNQHRQSGTATRQHSATATDDIFHLFNDTHINSLENDNHAASSEQEQQPAAADACSAEKQG